MTHSTLSILDNLAFAENLMGINVLGGKLHLDQKARGRETRPSLSTVLNFNEASYMATIPTILDIIKL